MMKSIAFCFIAAIIYAFGFCCMFCGYPPIFLFISSTIGNVLAGIALMSAGSFEDQVRKLEKEIKKLKGRKNNETVLHE